MAESKNKNHFDTLVIGAGLAGLLVGARLAQAGRRFLLLEEKDDVGGLCRPHVHALGTLDFGFKSLPATEAGHRALDLIEEHLETSVNRSQHDLAPITYEGGKFKPFVGFGADPPAYIDELDYYLVPQRLLPQEGPRDWVNHLRKKIPSEAILLRSVVTRILVEDGVAQGVVVNGAQIYSADRIIYTGSIKVLNSLLPIAALTTRAGQRLAKTPFWTAVGLDLIHAQKVTDSRGLHVLMGTKEESGPCLGYFYPPGQNLVSAAPEAANAQVSQWFTLVPAEGAEDPEITGASVRKIKKQLKRAYPEALDSLLHERIFVANLSHGSADLKLSDGLQAPGIEGLWLAGSGVAAQRNLIGVCEQARQVLLAMGIETPHEPSDASPHEPLTEGPQT